MGADDQLFEFVALALGIAVLFAGIPEGLFRLASLMGGGGRRSSERITSLPPRAAPSVMPPAASSEANAVALEALERAIIGQIEVKPPPVRPAVAARTRSPRARPADPLDVRPTAPPLTDVRPLDTRAPDGWPATAAEPRVGELADNAAAYPELAWYYEEAGQSRGPIGERAIRERLHDGRLSPDALVWNETFGAFWRPVRETGLAGRATSAPPPLPRRGRGGRSRAPRRRIAALAVAAVVLAALAGVVVAVRQFRPAPSAVTAQRGTVPACDSSAARALAKQAIESAPVARLINAILIELYDIQQTNYDVATQKRSCSATAMLNTGQNAVRYTLEWLNQTSEDVWIEFQQYPF